MGEAAAADTAYVIKLDQVGARRARPLCRPDVIKLTEWVSDYYLAGPGATLAAALPPHGLTSRRDRFKTRRMVALTAAALDEFLPKMTPRQRDAIERAARLTRGACRRRSLARARRDRRHGDAKSWRWG